MPPGLKGQPLSLALFFLAVSLTAVAEAPDFSSEQGIWEGQGRRAVAFTPWVPERCWEVLSAAAWAVPSYNILVLAYAKLLAKLRYATLLMHTVPVIWFMLAVFTS